MMTSASGLHTCPLTQVSAPIYTQAHTWGFIGLWRKGIGKLKN